MYVEGVSLSEGKKLFGGKPVFGGFAQDTVIYKGTEQDVKEAAWKILDECGQVGIMLGADCTVPNDIDDSRLECISMTSYPAGRNSSSMPLNSNDENNPLVWPIFAMGISGLGHMINSAGDFGPILVIKGSQIALFVVGPLDGTQLG